MLEDSMYIFSLGFLLLAFVYSWKAANNIAKRGLSSKDHFHPRYHRAPRKTGATLIRK